MAPGRIGAGLFFAAVLALAALRGSSYVPAEVWDHGTDWTDPVTMSPAQAYRFVLDAVRPYGGLPPDAQLEFARKTTVMRAGHAYRPVHVMSRGFLWHPSGEATRFGERDDTVLAQVVSAKVTTCENTNCTRYSVTYRPELQLFVRWWRPAFWRAWLQSQIRAHAAPVAAPFETRTSCPGGVDVAALRRVIGTSHGLLMVAWRHKQPSITSSLAVPGTTFAQFSPALIAHERSAEIRATRAIVSDTPDDSRYRVVWLYVNGARWSRFASDDTEPTCRTPLTSALARKPPTSNVVLPFSALTFDAVYRSTEEARHRTHNRPGLRDAQLVSIARTLHGSIVRTRAIEDDGVWTASFHYDTNGGLTSVEYTKR